MQSGAAPALTGLAVVDVGVAVAAGEAGPAGTAVAPVGVLARGPIPAGALHTLIDVNLTGLTWGQSRTGVVWAGGTGESPRGDNRRCSHQSRCQGMQAMVVSHPAS